MTETSDLKPGLSWQPVDLRKVLDGGHVDPPPSLLPRDDGPCLLYAGKVHTLSGESESGKTWLALTCCAAEIIAGRHVLYIDFEDSADAVVARLVALGCPAAAIVNYFHYVRPVEPFTPAGRQILKEAIGADPSLCVVDGVTEAMTVHGLDPLSNADVAIFFARLPRPLADAGAAVVLIDHVTKSRDGRGRYALGAQHKLAGIDGVAYIIELLKPFGHGQHGTAKLIIAKDRPGRVREHAAGNVAAILHLRSEPGGTVFAELHPPARAGRADQEEHTGWRPTILMQRVSRYVEDHPRLSKRAIRAAVSGKNDHKDLALELLLTEGYLTKVRDGRADAYESVKPYYQEENDP